jgi:hypothetical protein
MTASASSEFGTAVSNELCGDIVRDGDAEDAGCFRGCHAVGERGSMVA